MQELSEGVRDTIAGNLRRILERLGVDTSSVTDAALLTLWDSGWPDPETPEDAQDYLEAAKHYL